MPDRLGPLAFTDGEWVIGDPAGDHVRLRGTVSRTGWGASRLSRFRGRA